jgi:hypothetical protein
VLDAAAERHLRQVAPAQLLVLQRLSTGRAGEVERRDGEFQQRDVRPEPPLHVTGSRCRHEVVEIVARAKPDSTAV